jgi:hypothetical protein
VLFKSNMCVHSCFNLSSYDIPGQISTQRYQIFKSDLRCDNIIILFLTLIKVYKICDNILLICERIYEKVNFKFKKYIYTLSLVKCKFFLAGVFHIFNLIWYTVRINYIYLYTVPMICI